MDKILARLEQHGKEFLEDIDFKPVSTQTRKATAVVKPQKTSAVAKTALQNKVKGTVSTQGNEVKRKRSDEIDEILSLKNQVKKVKTVSEQAAPKNFDEKLERKLFMSHKVSKIHAEVTGGSRSAPKAPEAIDELDMSLLTPEEFEKLQLEIEKFGAKALDKRAARAYRARFLAKLGAKADTAPRTAASIGKGMARATDRRQRKRLQEEVDLGLRTRKSLSNQLKKKKPEVAKDRGLEEIGSSFRNGVLKLKSASQKKRR